jgi:hypothetical protein
MVCFPTKINFEQQIYKAFYDSLLIESDLQKLESFELKLLKNTILLKNEGKVESEKVRDILSVYAFSKDFKERFPLEKIEALLSGNARINYDLIKKLE